MPRASRANVLVVDDELHSLIALQHLLSGPDRNVVPARSGEEALRHILKTDFAIILLDVRMPGMDGFETAALIRQMRRCRHTPIIFLTAAVEDAQAMSRGYEIGAADFILKPVDSAVLQSKVSVFVDLYNKSADLTTQIDRRKEAERELYRANEDLETKIRERTASLIAANDLLQKEIARRERIEVDLHKAKQAAEAANLAKSQFLANMSHEIRTPMNAIIGMTELALETTLSAEQREYLGLVRDSGESLLKVINEILDFSKIEAGRLEVETVPLSLRESLGDTMKALALQAHRKGLELAYDVAPDVPDAVLGDPVRLRQIVVNLVDNAIKFTERGEVVMRVRAEPAEAGSVTCHFTVRDTGVGIAPEKQGAIFAPFLQADTSTTRIFGGTGLGLTISARLVQMLHGRISVESEPGVGSTFHFSMRFGLPAAMPAAEPVADFNGVRVLVVDDHTATRDFLVGMMREWNVEAREAAGADEAAQAVAAAHRAGRGFHLVLIDDSLPGTDAPALAARLRQFAAPAIVMLATALRRDENGVRAKPGEFSCLTKPVKQSELQAAVRAAIAGAGGDTRSTPRSDRRQPEAGSRLRVLLVEDNPVNRKLALRTLEKSGHAVAAAENGEAALEALQRGRFDLVLMDVQMPKMDGIEATRIIRERENSVGGHIPIIALTAHAMAGDRERCLQAGMDGYLIKPIRPASLLEAIERLRVAPPRPADVRGDAKPILDREALLERVNGDTELLAEVTDMFARDSGRLIAEAKQAAARSDSAAFRYALHTLRGMLGNLSACAAEDAAGRLHALDPADDPDGIETAAAVLEREIEFLRAELAGMLSETVA